jgi:ubiquinone/menaquinone biosynthesis C-methylase UbiE
MMNRKNLLRFGALAAILLLATIATAAESEIDHLAAILELKPGSSVADVGAGSGEVSFAIAARVRPDGKVYSTEIVPKLLDKIRAGAIRAGDKNIIVVAGTRDQTGLPVNCCDAIFLREVYHHLTDPIPLDRSLYRSLRPGGRLAIIDFEPTPLAGPPPPGVPRNRGGHGVPKRIVLEELTGAGFQFVKTMQWPISATIKHYCMLFIKPVRSTKTKSTNRNELAFHTFAANS